MTSNSYEIWLCCRKWTKRVWNQVPAWTGWEYATQWLSWELSSFTPKVKGRHCSSQGWKWSWNQWSQSSTTEDVTRSWINSWASKAWKDSTWRKTQWSKRDAWEWAEETVRAANRSLNQRKCNQSKREQNSWASMRSQKITELEHNANYSNWILYDTDPALQSK